MAILRADRSREIPVLGRLLAAGAEKRQVAAQQETEAFIASSFGSWEEDKDGSTAPTGRRRRWRAATAGPASPAA